MVTPGGWKICREVHNEVWPGMYQKGGRGVRGGV